MMRLLELQVFTSLASCQRNSLLFSARPLLRINRIGNPIYLSILCSVNPVPCSSVVENMPRRLSEGSKKHCLRSLTTFTDKILGDTSQHEIKRLFVNRPLQNLSKEVGERFLATTKMIGISFERPVQRLRRCYFKALWLFRKEG